MTLDKSSFDGVTEDPSRTERGGEVTTQSPVDLKGKDTSETTMEGPSSARRPRLRTGIEWFRRGFAVVLVLVCLVVVGLSVVALSNGTWAANAVLSGSMRPGFTVGGIVVSERVPVRQLVNRDVIVFRDPQDPSNVMVHRIVSLQTKSSGEVLIHTQGDANNAQDPWTLSLRGGDAYKVRWSLPIIGYIAVFYGDYRGILLLGAGIALALVALSTYLAHRRTLESEVDDEPVVNTDLEANQS